MKKIHVHDLEARFGEIEKRVRSLVTQNKELSIRVHDLEQELLESRKMLEEYKHLPEQKRLAREKIKHVLTALEQTQLNSEL
ncbi:MAG: hypothetical protein WC539_02565 [Nitrospirota bacterium]